MNNRGFISITLVIGISTMLLAFVYIQSIDTFHFFDLATRKQYRLMNFYNAYNCIDRAILNLTHDYFYRVNEPVVIPELNCSIDLVEGEEEILIKTTGNYMRANVSREARVRMFENSIQIQPN